MKLSQCFFGTAALLCAAFVNGAAHAQECGDKELVRAGEVTGTGTSVGFIVGARWGEGAVRLDDGRVFEFRVRGVKAAEYGAAQVTVSGVVFNLERIEDFSGRYVGLAGGVTVANQGAGVASFTNGDCVTVHITRDEVIGAQASLPFPGTLDVEVTRVVQ